MAPVPREFRLAVQTFPSPPQETSSSHSQSKGIGPTKSLENVNCEPGPMCGSLPTLMVIGMTARLSKREAGEVLARKTCSVRPINVLAHRVPRQPY